MPDRLTQESVAFADALTFAAIPADVVSAAKRCLVDGVGVAIAGLETDIASRLAAFVIKSGAGPARLFGDPGQTSSISNAALYLGACGNALDWDDVQMPDGEARPFGLLMHGTTPLLATLLSTTELIRNKTDQVVSGEAFLTAFVAGWEVSGKLAVTVTPDHYFNGFHTSGTLGTFGCAIAAGKLLGLSAEHMTWSLGHAASMAAGIQASMGTMTKPMHVGWCAARGLEAALLARAGIDGPDDALDGPRGYLTTTSRTVDVDRALGRFGNPFVLSTPGVSAKPYPCGAVTHPGMYAFKHVMVEHTLNAGDIKCIAVAAGSKMWNLISYPFAETPFQAKYSFPFLLAAIALRGTAGRAEFGDDFILSEACVAFQKKVTTRVDETVQVDGSDIVNARLTIYLNDGRTFVVDGLADYPGGPVMPLNDGAVDQKFMDATSGLLSAEQAVSVRSMLWSFETQPDASALLDEVGTITVPSL
ncbi:MAG: MmgE/PrpD family protein [Rhodospirillaceae bacterium]|nr:MmgE/PrpD family protein [Rhodospirillaceae bacterium]